MQSDNYNVLTHCIQYNTSHCPSTTHGSCYKQLLDLCPRSYGKSYRPYALVVFTATSIWLAGVVRSWLPSTSSTMGQRRGMSSRRCLLKHVEVDFIFIVAKVLINKLNESFKSKNQKQPIFFCKSRNSTHTDFSFFARFASQSRAKSGKSFIFYAY